MDDTWLEVCGGQEACLPGLFANINRLLSKVKESLQSPINNVSLWSAGERKTDVQSSKLLDLNLTSLYSATCEIGSYKRSFEEVCLLSLSHVCVSLGFLCVCFFVWFFFFWGDGSGRWRRWWKVCISVVHLCVLTLNLTVNWSSYFGLYYKYIKEFFFRETCFIQSCG